MTPTYCCVNKCSSNSLNNRSSFFRFPLDPLRCSIWLKNVGRDDLENKTSIELHKAYKVCAKHFAKEMYSNLSKNNRLKRTAVPTIFNFDNSNKEINVPQGEIKENSPFVDSQKTTESPQNITWELIPFLNFGKGPGDHSLAVVSPTLDITPNLSDNKNRSDEQPEYFLEESNSVSSPEVVQDADDQESFVGDADELHCRTCFEVIDTQRHYLLLVMGDVSKTIKEMIIFCVPQMESTLSDDDVICNKCLDAIKYCVKFIENCLDVEQKIKKLNEKVRVSRDDDVGDESLPGSIDNEDNIEYVNVDHDYVIKCEPEEIIKEEYLDTQSSMLENALVNLNHQSVDSNSVEDYTKSNQTIFKYPSEILGPQILVVHDSGEVQGNLIATSDKPQNVLEELNCDEVTTPHVEEYLQITDRDRFKCPNCTKLFKTENYLFYHMKRVHNMAKLPMEENDEEASSEIERVRLCSCIGKKSIHKPRRLKRKHPFCDDGFETTQMESHLQQLNEGQSDITQPKKIRRRRCIKCRTCSERFTSKADLKVHLEIHPPLICEQCGKQFIMRESLNAHKATHNAPNSYICEICGKCYKDRSLLNFHLKIHENKKYNCEKCPKFFRTKIHLKHHVNYVHAQGYTGQCSQCGKIFKNRGSLKIHVRLVHLKLKPFKCEICDKGFGRADYLRQHVSSHNGKQSELSQEKVRRWIAKAPASNSGELQPCRFCGKRFQSIPKLKMHLQTHVIRFPCQFCPLTFARKQSCKRHELLHNGLENFFRCNICWKRLSSEEELDEHTDTKHNNPKYPCHVCGTMFHTTYLLNHHNLLEHNGPEDAENAKQIIYESLLEVSESNET